MRWPWSKKEDPWVACHECGVVLEREKAGRVEYEEQLQTFTGSWSWEKVKRFFCAECQPEYDRVDRRGRFSRGFFVNESGIPFGYIPAPEPKPKKKRRR